MVAAAAAVQQQLAGDLPVTTVCLLIGEGAITLHILKKAKHFLTCGYTFTLYCILIESVYQTMAPFKGQVNSNV